MVSAADSPYTPSSWLNDCAHIKKLMPRLRTVAILRSKSGMRPTLGNSSRINCTRRCKCPLELASARRWARLSRRQNQLLSPACYRPTIPRYQGLILFREVNACFWAPGASAFFGSKIAGFRLQNCRKRRPQSVDASGVRFCSFTSRKSIRSPCQPLIMTSLHTQNSSNINLGSRIA